MTKTRVSKDKNGTAIRTHSARQTTLVGFSLAKELLKLQAQKGAIVIALEGELGSGKTTFLQGFARGLGVREKILSPTFIIFRKFKIQNPKSKIKSKVQNSKFQTFYHFDCYRIENVKELYALGWKEIIEDPKAIVVVEWADRVRMAMPKSALWIKFLWLGEKKRELRVKGLLSKFFHILLS